MSTTARVSGRRITIQAVDGTRVLVQEITIDCPACGHLVVQILGHHVQTVAQILRETIEAEPDLCRPAWVKQGPDTHVVLDLARRPKGGEN